MTAKISNPELLGNFISIELRRFLRHPLAYLRACQGSQDFDRRFVLIVIITETFYSYFEKLNFIAWHIETSAWRHSRGLSSSNTSHSFIQSSSRLEGLLSNFKTIQLDFAGLTDCRIGSSSESMAVSWQLPLPMHPSSDTCSAPRRPTILSSAQSTLHTQQVNVWAHLSADGSSINMAVERG